MSFIAQIFTTSLPAEVSGTYIPAARIFFRRKDPGLTVIAALVETEGGEPNMSKILAYSVIGTEEIVISNDGSLATDVVFNKPTFLASNRNYALVIQPEGNSPEFELWTSVAGLNDVSSGTQVFTSPIKGSLLEASDGVSWRTHVGESLKMDIFRCRFTNFSGKAVFNHDTDDYITVDGFTRANSEIGIEVGDVVLAVNANTSLLMVGNNVPYGVIQRVDEGAGELVLDLSTGLFSANTTIQVHRLPSYSNTQTASSSTRVATATITEVSNIPVHAIVPNFSTFQPATSDILYKFTATVGAPGSFSLFSTLSSVENNEELEYRDQSRFILSRSNEVTQLSGTPSAKYEVEMSTRNNFISPVIDLSRGKTSLVIENLINNDDTDEDTRYGNALSKYVSKTVVLADGQEAEDLRVLIGAYRPVDTDIKVYAKFRNATDEESFEEKAWTELNYRENSQLIFSNPFDQADFVEYEFEVPETPPVATAAFLDYVAGDGQLRYTNSAGSVFVGFKQFAIKIVLLSSNPVRVPKLSDLRAIALQI